MFLMRNKKLNFCYALLAKFLTVDIVFESDFMLYSLMGGLQRLGGRVKFFMLRVHGGVTALWSLSKTHLS